MSTKRIPIVKNGLLETEDFNPQAALYIVREGQYLFRWRDDSGACGAKFLRSEDVQAAFSKIERDSGWIAPNLLRFGGSPKGDWFTLWIPAQAWDIQLQFNEILQTIHIPLPNLIFTGVGLRYMLHAFPAKDFDPKGNMACAPLPNVNSSTGQICWGSNLPPQASHTTALKAWELFIKTPFSAHLANGSSKKYPNDVRLMLLELQGTRVYPKKDLEHAGQTVSWFIERIIRNGA